MKKIISVFVSLLVVFSVFAQSGNEGRKDKMTPEQRAEKQTQMMKERLQLTDKQSTQLYDINLKYAKSAQTEIEKEKQFREERKQLMQNRENEINALLTPAQKTAFDSMKKSAKENQRHKGGDKRPERKNR